MEKSCSNIGVQADGFREFAAFNAVLGSEIEPSVEDKKSDIVSANEELFALIFSVDPKTLLPSGDIAMFMNENTSPQVKQFIQMNLQRPYDVLADSNLVEGVDDDIIAQYSRNQNESVSDYRRRLYDSICKELQSQKKSDS